MTPKKLHIYTYTLPIRWRDVDPYQHVNHSVFFTYMEEARWEWFYSLRIKEQLNILTPIVGAQISYKKPLIYPGNAVVQVYAEPPENKSWTIYHRIYAADNTSSLCAEASVKFVAYDPQRKCVIPVPEILKTHLCSTGFCGQ